MRAMIAIVGFVVTGCAGPLGYAGGPDALKEIVRIKDANITCVIANTPYGKGSVLFLNLDKGVIPAGGISVDDACKTVITTGAVPAPTR